MTRRKAVVLLSGGLDSMLAARILQEQEIEVVGLHLYTGLCITEHKRRTGQRDAKGRRPQNPVFRVAETLGIPLEVLDISSTYLEVITKPKYGRGSGVNPCKDCRIHMFQYAKSFMDEIGADFIATGEVLGQRPMSQIRSNLDFIHKRSGIADLILMPLSAKLLPPTLPEREGWVDRERLYAIRGRSRKPQMELARRFGFTEWEQPAGGCCFLTDEAYARKFRDLFAHDPDRRLTMEDVVLLGVGRHFRLSPRAKLIVGRHRDENAVLERHANGHALLRTVGVPGPLGVALGAPTPEEEEQMARILARYSKGRDLPEIEVEVRPSEGEPRRYRVAPAKLREIEPLRL